MGFQPFFKNSLPCALFPLHNKLSLEFPQAIISCIISNVLPINDTYEEALKAKKNSDMY